jgi:hypothetical protein
MKTDRTFCFVHNEHIKELAEHQQRIKHLEEETIKQWACIRRIEKIGLQILIMCIGSLVATLLNFVVKLK